MIDSVTRGDPESPLKWTCKSTRRLSLALGEQGISPASVRGLLHDLDYSLQANRKTREGIDHPDRDKQFKYISENVQKFLNSRQPVISVDTKKTGLLVKSAIDYSVYEKGIKVSDAELGAIALKPHAFHCEWNYTVRRKRFS